MSTALRLGLCLLAIGVLSGAGCYLHHRPEDAGTDAEPTRCGSERCALVPSVPRIEVRSEGLIGNVEGVASDLRAAPEVNGIAFELDPCAYTGAAPCPTTITITQVGDDIADPAVLSGPVEASIRPEAIVVRADLCPGCADDHDAGQLYLAAVSGELSTDFDLDLHTVGVEDGGLVCTSSAAAGDRSARHRITFGLAARPAVTVTLDEGESGRLPGEEIAMRVLHSSYECVTPDLPLGSPLSYAEWVIWIDGPR